VQYVQATKGLEDGAMEPGIIYQNFPSPRLVNAQHTASGNSENLSIYAIVRAPKLNLETTYSRYKGEPLIG
jgi:hypothetical protein